MGEATLKTVWLADDPPAHKPPRHNPHHPSPPHTTPCADSLAHTLQALDSFMSQFGPKKSSSDLEQLQQRLAAIYTDPAAIRQRGLSGGEGDSSAR